MTLIGSYGFNPTEFKNKLAIVGGVISGSAAVRVWFNPDIEYGDLPDFIENDIDIFIPIKDYKENSSSVKTAEDFIKYIKTEGWYYDEPTSAKRGSNKLHYMPSDKIDEIYSFIKNERKIQIVIVSINVFEFLKTEKQERLKPKESGNFKKA